MDCKSTEKKLIFYIENSLPQTEVSVVKDHLNTCPSCSQKLTYLQETLSFIETEKALTPKPFLYTRTTERMQQRAAQQIHGSIKWLKPVAVAAALLVGLFFGFWLGQSSVTQPLPDPDIVYEVAYLFHEVPMEQVETLFLEDIF
ncbi:MAG: zf-HC2 domain-containing protein [Bacteroidales bacterium]|jgi:predicted anti-sigma-YlaC factor YlaD|nr:zf-HC2 domain-containing protein [Bacteroidales bacterium]